MPKCQRDPTCGIFLKRGLFKDIKTFIPMCRTHKYKITNTKYTNTQIQHMTKCQKDTTCGIFLKRGLFKDIKNDIPMCRTHKYKNTKTQIQHMTKCQKDPTCGIFLKRGFSEPYMYHLCIVSMHHQRIISASSAHHQRIISASSVYHCSVFIAELSPVYCCLVFILFCHLATFFGQFQRPGDTATSLLTFFNETSCFAFLLCFNLALFCLVWQFKESIRTSHLLQLGELVHTWPGIGVPHQVVQVDRNGIAWNLLSFRNY